MQKDREKWGGDFGGVLGQIQSVDPQIFFPIFEACSYSCEKKRKRKKLSSPILRIQADRENPSPPLRNIRPFPVARPSDLHRANSELKLTLGQATYPRNLVQVRPVLWAQIDLEVFPFPPIWGETGGRTREKKTRGCSREPAPPDPEAARRNPHKRRRYVRPKFAKFCLQSRTRREWGNDKSNAYADPNHFSTLSVIEVEAGG
jgi:hypothetical protein